VVTTLTPVFRNPNPTFTGAVRVTNGDAIFFDSRYHWTLNTDGYVRDVGTVGNGVQII
jgi:hypothetical protein